MPQTYSNTHRNGKIHLFVLKRGSYLPTRELSHPDPLNPLNQFHQHSLLPDIIIFVISY